MIVLYVIASQNRDIPKNKEGRIMMEEPVCLSLAMR